MEILNKQVQNLCDLVVDILDQSKAFDITILDVRGKTSITDIVVIANGQSDRQTKAIASHVAQGTKDRGFPLVGIEGELEGKWILVDLGDVIVHIMLPATRVFYQLEQLWKTNHKRGNSRENSAVKTKAS